MSNEKSQQSRYVLVNIDEVDSTFWYIDKNDSVNKDDYVSVPFGKENKIIIGQAVEVRNCEEGTYPFPPDKTKKIIEIIDRKDIDKQNAEKIHNYLFVDNINRLVVKYIDDKEKEDNLHKGKEYKIISYTPPFYYLMNECGKNCYYSTKKFKITKYLAEKHVNQHIIKILDALVDNIMESSDYGMYCDEDEMGLDIEMILDSKNNIETGLIDIERLEYFFLPTGPIHELSIANGWDDSFERAAFAIEIWLRQLTQSQILKAKAIDDDYTECHLDTNSSFQLITRIAQLERIYMHRFGKQVDYIGLPSDLPLKLKYLALEMIVNNGNSMLWALSKVIEEEKTANILREKSSLFCPRCGNLEITNVDGGGEAIRIAMHNRIRMIQDEIPPDKYCSRCNTYFRENNQEFYNAISELYFERRAPFEKKIKILFGKEDMKVEYSIYHSESENVISNIYYKSKFIEDLTKCYIEYWDQQYITPYAALDGEQWYLKLIIKQRSIEIQGSYAYPPHWDLFIKSIEKYIDT